MIIARYLNSCVSLPNLRQKNFYVATVSYTFETDDTGEIVSKNSRFRIKASSPESAKRTAIEIMDQLVIYGNLLTIDGVSLEPTVPFRVGDAEGE